MRITVKATDLRMKEPRVDYTHEIIAVGIPTVGYIIFTCSSNPKAKTHTHVENGVPLCPWCRAHNPLREVNA